MKNRLKRFLSRMASLRDKFLTGAEIVILLFLMMTTFFMMPGNVWGEEIYTHIDKDGTLVITNTPPQENIDSDTKKSSSYKDSTSDDRLHWGRDNAVIDEQNIGKKGQRKKVNDGRGIDAGKYNVKIKKIGNNLYQDIYTRIIIKTQDCVELAGRDESVLDWSGVSGELYFKNTNKSCIVKKVYK